ncbi:dioxygenase [Aspergillus neoniger CBS 115656]|uniref:Dioxygenase n=1 Tax=Aspergillus neoniger (strain CBS 115656) TaxID=1448310 RepID=A0A318YL90_ASPNB|nr:dioxygenase [Aspergillus neoniger CBS 115656]PYH33423.1 dioxygenase [Aspergillus neoniger CBS 115656]
MHFPKLTLILLAAGTAVSHPGPHDILPRAEIQRRSDMAKRCASQVGGFNQRRMAKRAMQKRWEGSGHNTTFEIVTEAPYYETIQNNTCVLTPEVTRGPYVWPRSQTLLLDMATCEPLPNALLDFWHCNATGSYSSFTGLSPNTPFPTLLSELNVTDYDMGVTDLHTDDTTWLRGMWPTNEDGVMEMKTIFPGFYVERAIHIHAQVHTDWTVRENGTIIASNTVSTGQLYFEEELEQEVMSMEPYASHTQINRTTNAEDTVCPEDIEGGYNPVVSVVPVDEDDLSKGLIGYITIGVDTTAIETFSK